MRCCVFALLWLLCGTGAASAADFVTVVIRTDKGDVEVELDAKRAPVTVKNFLSYVEAGSYDGGRFHRTVRADNQPNNKVKIAVIQAGIDPKKKEFAPIKLERTNKTGLKHVDGAISMARDGPDTATGDFFICVGDQPELDFGGKRNPDGQGFAAFGKVVRGMDVVKEINAAKDKEQTLTPPVRILEARQITTPCLVGHRGLLRHAPENTLASFESCLALRLDFELDVRRSKDGTLVVLHDADVSRTTDGKGKVSELTLAEIKKLDAGRWFGEAFAGQRVPTLDEVFALVKERGDKDTLIAIDLKIDDTKVETDVVKLANKHGVLSRLVFIGTTIDSADVRKRIKDADAKAPTSVLAQTADDLEKALATKDADWAYLRFVPTAAQVKQAHKAGKKVFLVGNLVMPNKPDNWNKARLAGADAMLMDYPLECRTHWREKK